MGAISRAPILLLAAAAFALAGCGSGPRFSGGGATHYAVGQPHYTVAPYQVNGVWYYPKVDYSYDQTGTASWYGPGFDHRATADGEIYDMNELTAAHKTLPLPSVVEVTNLQNGRELRLRVNDRGPFVGDRLIDVSRRAAQLLGFAGTGTAPVRVRVLKDDSIQVAEAAMLGQVGPVGVAAAPVAARTQIAAAAPMQAAPPPMPPPRPVQIAAAPLPPPRQQIAAAAPPPPPPEYLPPERPVAEPAPAPPRRMAAATQHHYWPSLIASAHAETLHLPLAAAPIAARGHGGIFIQAGAFAMPENARRVRARIAVLGAAEVVPATVNGSALYRVRLGPVSSAEAHRLLSKVIDSGYPGARLVEQ